VAVREAMAFSFAPFNGALKRSEGVASKTETIFHQSRAIT